MSNQNLFPVVTAAVALAAGAATATWFLQRQAALQLEAGLLLPQPRDVQAFALTDQDGRPFTPQQLQGHWSLLFSGFTHCPDVCPTTLQLLKQLEARLQQGGRTFQPVFLSLDPQRDTPEQLARYVRYFSPSFTGVTGSLEELNRFSASLGLAYVKVPGETDADYTIDHSSALVLFNPRGQVAAYFSAPHKLDPLAADLEHLIPVR